MSSSTRRFHHSKQRNKESLRHTTDRLIEHRIDKIKLATIHMQMSIKLSNLKFQILKMANAETNDSISLLESPTTKPAMSQELNDEGIMVFKCTTCGLSYKQLKRLQNHLLAHVFCTMDGRASLALAYSVRLWNCHMIAWRSTVPD